MFKVTEANGKSIKPVVVNVANLSGTPRFDEVYLLNGYETGSMIGIPDEVAEREDIVPQKAAWQFRLSFVLTSIGRLRNLPQARV